MLKLEKAKKKIKSLIKNKAPFLIPPLKYFSQNYVNILVITFAILFAARLMTYTFGYDKDNIIMTEKLHSDFLSHLSLIRSFSMGENFPPEYPHFPGQPIKYHFLFYALVGLMEKFGIRIDIALNLLSIIGFAGLLIIIYLLAKKITGSRFVGVGSVFSIILNPSLSWLYYFLIGDNKLGSFNELFTTTRFASFGPYDNNIISAFWNLNIFTNQRHFAFSLFLMLIVIWLTVYCKGKWKAVLAILLLGIMSWTHKATLMMAFIILGVFFIAFAGMRKRILTVIIMGLIAALPGLIYLSMNVNGFSNNIQEGAGLFVWQPGFLFKSTEWWEFSTNSDLEQWLIYWFFNMGLLPFLAIGGYIVMSIFDTENYKGEKLAGLYVIINPKTAWFWSATIMFAIGNLLKFGPDMANNHKLINYTMYIWAIYAFYFLRKTISATRLFGTIATIIFTMGLFFGGFCDLFPVFNDRQGKVSDIAADSKAQWVVENTKPQDVFLNLTSDFKAVTITGRKIYLGVAYFNWSLGYPVDMRDDLVKEVIASGFEKDKMCRLLKDENISYFFTTLRDSELYEQPFDPKVLISKYPEGIDIGDGMYMFSTELICQDPAN